MHLKPVHGWSHGVDLQESLLDKRRDVKAYGAHVPDQLIAGFFQREIETALFPLAGAGGQLSSNTGLAGARLSTQEDSRAAEVPSVQHLIKTRYTTRDALPGHLVLHHDRGDGEHDDARIGYEE